MGEAVCLMFQSRDNPYLGARRQHDQGDFMTKADVWKLRPADLRRIASRTREPERERKMLALAEQLEERERDEHEQEL